MQGWRWVWRSTVRSLADPHMSSDLQVTLGLLLLVSCVMMTAFLAYHLHLIANGMTTYETFKRRERAWWLLDRAEAPGTDAAALVVASPSRGWWGWTPIRSSKLSVDAAAGQHVYNRGFAANLQEVLFPDAMLKQSTQRERVRRRKR